MQLLIPEQSPYISGERAILNTLVEAGETRSHITLSPELHLFLIDFLEEYLDDPTITHQVLAIGLLGSIPKFGTEKEMMLKRAGDASLILAGLFPERALRLNVSPLYFQHMGQASYGSLAIHLESRRAPERGQFYHELARQFSTLQQVLKKARGERGEWKSFEEFRASLNWQ